MGHYREMAWLPFQKCKNYLAGCLALCLVSSSNYSSSKHPFWVSSPIWLMLLAFSTCVSSRTLDRTPIWRYFAEVLPPPPHDIPNNFQISLKIPAWRPHFFFPVSSVSWWCQSSLWSFVFLSSSLALLEQWTVDMTIAMTMWGVRSKFTWHYLITKMIQSETETIFT